MKAGGIWRCRVIATGEIKTLRTYDFGWIDAAGNYYTQQRVVRLEMVK